MTNVSDAQEILLNLSCAVSNLVILHSAIAEMGMRGRALEDALFFTANALQAHCDELDTCLMELRKREVERNGQVD